MTDRVVNNTVAYTIARMRIPPTFTVTAGPPPDDGHQFVSVSMKIQRTPESTWPADTIEIQTSCWLDPGEEPEAIAMRIRERMQWLALHEIDEWTMLDGVHLNPPHDVRGDGEVKFTADTIKAWNALKICVGAFNYGRPR